MTAHYDEAALYAHHRRCVQCWKPAC